jgi:hypothetical protein
MGRLKFIAAILLAVNALGFFIGCMDTINARGSGHYTPVANGGLIWISDNRSGCTYETFSALMSPGYIVACELFRKRFSHDRIEKVFK